MFFSKIKENLRKTKENLDIKLSNVFANNKDIDKIIDELEETLILSDVGINTSVKICDNLRQELKKQVDKSPEAIKELLKKEMEKILLNPSIDNNVNMGEKQVILIVGVNGVGKTTSIGKIANLYKKQGKRVLLAAADTFRAGAVEQLEIWANRTGCDICTGKEGQDPASVIFDAANKFKNEAYDILICDTAGRLHNKTNLMNELEKINRIIDKNLNGIQKEVLIVLDATTGQNGAIQVKSFYEKTNLNGIILTKLDSTAKGGVVFSIVCEMNLPIKYIGIGEQIDDIELFNPKEFVEAII